MGFIRVFTRQRFQRASRGKSPNPGYDPHNNREPITCVSFCCGRAKSSAKAHVRRSRRRRRTTLENHTYPEISQQIVSARMNLSHFKSPFTFHVMQLNAQSNPFLVVCSKLPSLGYHLKTRLRLDRPIFSFSCFMELECIVNKHPVSHITLI
jgi:hypothetical protein